MGATTKVILKDGGPDHCYYHTITIILGCQLCL